MWGLQKLLFLGKGIELNKPDSELMKALDGFSDFIA